jgi:hypothetical protein
MDVELDRTDDLWIARPCRNRIDSFEWRYDSETIPELGVESKIPPGVERFLQTSRCIWCIHSHE